MFVELPVHAWTGSSEGLVTSVDTEEASEKMDNPFMIKFLSTLETEREIEAIYTNLQEHRGDRANNIPL